jgi:hypothetical protein
MMRHHILWLIQNIKCKIQFLHFDAALAPARKIMRLWLHKHGRMLCKGRSQIRNRIKILPAAGTFLK